MRTSVVLLLTLPALLSTHPILSPKLRRENYDGLLRPNDPILLGERAGGVCPKTLVPDVVTIQFKVNKLWGISMQHKHFEVDGFWRMWWKDPRLAYESTQDGGCTDLIKLKSACTMERCDGSKPDAVRLWKPDLFFPYALHNSLGGEGDGSLFYVQPDGSVYFSQRARFKFDCKFQFSRLPYDTQHCVLSASSYAFNSSEVRLVWKGKDDGGGVIVDPPTTGDYSIGHVSTTELERTLVPGKMMYPTACFALRRDSAKFRSFTIFALLLVAASYSGYYISPAAAPGRIALAFLCTLIVLTNVNAVYRQLPAVTTGDSIFFVDFLLFTSLFNFAALLEYSFVNFGMQLDAAKKKKEADTKAAAHKQAEEKAKAERPASVPSAIGEPVAQETAAAETHVSVSSGTGAQPAEHTSAAADNGRHGAGDAEVGTRPHDEFFRPQGGHKTPLKLRARTKHALWKAKDLDLTCRWLFPLCYLLFVVVMLILLQTSYKNNVDCHENPHF